MYEEARAEVEEDVPLSGNLWLMVVHFFQARYRKRTRMHMHEKRNQRRCEVMAMPTLISI